MSETNKDHEEFEFIKEQILPKRHKKFKKWLIPFVMTILMAVVFGLVAALTFCFAEPRLYKRMHGDKEILLRYHLLLFLIKRMIRILQMIIR